MGGRAGHRQAEKPEVVRARQERSREREAAEKQRRDLSVDLAKRGCGRW